MNIINDGNKECDIMDCDMLAWWEITYTLNRIETKTLHLCTNCHRAFTIGQRILELVREEQI